MTVNATRAGRATTVLGVLLFGAAAAANPGRGCISAVGRDTGPSVSFGLETVTYELFGRACFVDTSFLAGVAGLMLAVAGGLLWAAGAADAFSPAPRDVR